MSTPALRFKDAAGREFPTWQPQNLGDVSDVRDGTHESPKYYSEGYPLITSKNLLTTGTIDLANVSLISEADFLSINKRSKVESGDILFGMIGTIGNPVVVTTSNFAIKNVALIKQKERLQNNFLVQYLKSSAALKRFENITVGNTQKFIALGKLRQLGIKLPSLPEQTKIANFLTAVDEKLAQLTRKHELLTQYKKGVMQQIFSQELRFKNDYGREFAEWEDTSLKAVAQIVGGGTPETGVNEYWNGDIQWFTPTELKSKYASRSKRTITEAGLKNSSAKILPVGTLLFSSRATVGDVSIALYECTTNQGFQSLIVNEQHNNQFIYYWILNNKNAFLEKASGSTFLEVSKKEIEKLPIRVPVIEEQTKIANFLTAIDDKITATQTQLAAVKQYKQGLLQQMFV